VRLSVSYLPTGELGYGRMGTEIVNSMRRLGVDFRTDQNEATGTHLHLSVPAHLLGWYDSQRLICMSMFESMHVPEAFRETIHHFDTFIVPSEQNRELFSQYHDDVRVVSLGVDPQVWKPTPRKPPTHRFEFLIGGSGLRKGGDVAYRAFNRAFPDGSWGDGPEPWLIMKSPRPNDFFGQRVMQINGRLPAEDEVALYENAHCYLQPSRGEGFGLQPLQAIVQGCPTILTDAHGHKAFSHLGIPLDSTLTDTPRGSFMLGDAGQWWEPDEDQLAERMRDVYENYDWHVHRAQHNAVNALQRFTWDNTARQVLDILGDLPSYSGHGRWVTPTIKKYRMRLNRSHTAQIAGHTYAWEAFTDYLVPADVKRIMFEAGFLDPECIAEEDPGLTDEQVERAGLLSGTESFCGTCHQMIGSGIQRADLLLAEG